MSKTVFWLVFFSLIRLAAAQAADEVVLLKNVPPVAQKAHECGPAALESIFRYWGASMDAQRISESVFKRGWRGVFNFSLTQEARRRGFWTQTPVLSSTASLKEWIQKGVPPLVMIDHGLLWAHQYHFIVISGFDDQKGVFYANTGQSVSRTIPYRDFEVKWKKAGRWCLIICPPEWVHWDPGSDGAVDLGFLFESQGRLEAAQKRYQAVLDKDRQNVTARFNLGNIYRKTQRMEEARAIFTGLLREGHLWGPASNNLACVRLDQGMPRQAAQVIRFAFRNGASREYDILDTAGLVSYRLNGPGLARRYFREALSKTPPGNAQALQHIQKNLLRCGGGE
ncbi:MAG: C39 family peptidase [Candidatus Omnitrophica bacterium]|nr:C39 family peptidase [Candidatus Omnitrophota bacterium]